MLKNIFKSQAFLEMPKQLQKSLLGTRMGARGGPPVWACEELAPVVGGI